MTETLEERMRRLATRNLTPEEREAQRQSWVRGMSPCEHGVADFETCPKCGKDKR